MAVVFDPIDSEALGGILDSDMEDYYTAHIENVEIDILQKYYENYDFDSADNSSESVISLTQLADTYVFRNFICRSCDFYSNETCSEISEDLDEYTRNIDNECPSKQWGSGHSFHQVFSQ